jgi:hypothetical protein
MKTKYPEYAAFRAALKAHAIGHEDRSGRTELLVLADQVKQMSNRDKHRYVRCLLEAFEEQRRWWHSKKDFVSALTFFDHADLPAKLISERLVYDLNNYLITYDTTTICLRAGGVTLAG